MDRGTRRAQKARIHVRLRQSLLEKIAENQEAAHSRNFRPMIFAQINELRRHIYKNEGKHYSRLFAYTYRRCDCSYCTNSRRYRTNREAERMKRDLHEWQKFGRGDGE